MDLGGVGELYQESRGGGITLDPYNYIYIYIYTRRKDGAKAPSLLDHLDLRSPTFGANPSSDAKTLDL